MVPLGTVRGDRLRPGRLDASVQVVRPDPQDADPRLGVPGVEPLDPAVPRLTGRAILEDPALHPGAVVYRHLDSGDPGDGGPGDPGNRLAAGQDP